MRGMDPIHAVVELASAADAPLLASLSRDLIEAGLGWSYRQPQIARFVQSANHTVIVARDGSRIAGFAVMEFGDERAHLVLLAVRPSHRRRGIGTRLAAWLIDCARAAGAACVHVEVREANVDARALYRRLGFVESEHLADYYRGREDAVRMRCMLRSADAPLPTWTPPPKARH